MLASDVILDALTYLQNLPLKRRPVPEGYDHSLYLLKEHLRLASLYAASPFPPDDLLAAFARLCPYIRSPRAISIILASFRLDPSRTTVILEDDPPKAESPDADREAAEPDLTPTGDPSLPGRAPMRVQRLTSAEQARSYYRALKDHSSGPTLSALQRVTKRLAKGELVSNCPELQPDSA